MAIDNEDDIQIGINYNEEGERQALKGIERLSTELQKLKKTASATTNDLAEIDKSVVKLQKTLQSATGSAKEFGGAVVSSGKPYTVAGARGQNTKQTTSASNAMQTASNLNMPDYRYMNKLQDELSDTKDLLSHLNQVYKNTAPVNKYLASQDAANSKLLQSNQALSSQIEALSDTSSKVKAVDNAIAQLNTRINSTNSAMSSANTLLANSTQNIQKYTQLVDGEDKALAGLKESVKLVVNEHDRLNSILKEQVNNQKKQITALTDYKRELLNTEKAQKEANKIADEQKKLEILKEQEERLLNAKRYYQSLVAQAKKYSDELIKISGLDLKGWQTVPSTTSQVTTQYDVGARMTAVKTDYEILLKNVEARKQSTQQIMQEAKVSAKSALEQQDLSSAITSTRQQIDALESSLNKNRATMQSVSNLSTNLKTNFNTYTKVLGENDKALAELKVSSTTVRDEFEESRKALKETMTTQRLQIKTLKDQEKQLILNKKAQDALNEAQEKSRMSAQAVSALGGMESGLARATSTINTGYNRSASAMDSSASMVREANNIEDYEKKIAKLQQAYTVLDTAISDNNATMKNASAIVDQLNVIYKQYSANLDENDEDAVELKQSIEKLQNAHKLATAEMTKQNTVLGRRKSFIKGEMSSWKALDNQVKKSNDKIKKDVLDTERKLKQAFANTRQNMRDISMFASSWGRTMSRFITAPLIAAAAQAVKFTAEMEMNIKSLEILLGNNARAAEELYTQVTRYAAETPYEIPDLTDATKQLLAFGSASTDVLQELSMLGDLAQNDAEKLESVTSAFGKVQARGVAHMRELNRFIMAGVPIIQTLGKVMNMSAEELFKAVEQGQVSFGAVKQSIEMLTSEGERFYNMSEKLATTVKGRWSTLSDEVNLALKSFAEDYMESILKIINKVIELAQAIQAMSPAQRNVIKNWALVAASIGPALLMVGKLVSSVRAIYGLMKNIFIVQKAMAIGSTIGIVLTIVSTLALALGMVYTNAKKATEEYREQKDLLDAIYSKSKISPTSSKELITVTARKYKMDEDGNDLLPNLSVEEISKVLSTQAASTVSDTLVKLNTKVGYYKGLIDELQSEIDTKQGIMDSFTAEDASPRLRRNSAPDYTEDIIINTNKIIELEKKLKNEYAETVQAPTFLSHMAGEFQLMGAELTSVSELMEVFKYNTEEAINGSVAQFGRFAGAVPLVTKAKEALAELDTFENKLTKDGDRFILNKGISEEAIDTALKNAGLDNNIVIKRIFDYLLDPEEANLLVLARLGEVFDGVEKYSASAIDDYIKATQKKFRQDNLATLLLENTLDSGGFDNNELVKENAKVMRDAYVNIANEAIDQIMASDTTLDFEGAVKLAKEQYEDVFANIAKYAKTYENLSTRNEFDKLVDKYGTELKQIDLNEIDKFRIEVEAITDKLKGTEYEVTTEAIDKLVQSFATLKFEDAKKALQDQKNELILNADALTELTDKQNGYKDAQIASLNQMRSYIEALRTLQEVANANPQVNQGASFSSVYGALQSRAKNTPVADTQASLLSNLVPVRAPQALAPLAQNIKEQVAFTKAEKEAIASLAAQYVQMDDVTKKLTESSEGYLNLVELITQAEWDSATSSAYVNKATEMLIANELSLSQHGKDANEIQIEFWTNLKNSLADTLDDSQIAVFDKLIASFQKLIDLDAEKAGTAFNDALKGIREEIDAFGRSASDTRAFESLNKQNELLQAIADDMGMSFEDVFAQFTGRSTDVDESLREKFELVRNILGDFDDYLKNQALEGIKGTVADYQKQVSQLGMTDKEKFMDDFIRQYEEAGIAVDNFTVFVLENLYDKIEKNNAMEDATEAIEGYNKQIAQLGMSEQAKAIDNLRRQGEASKWSAEKIDEATEALNRYYTAVANKEARDAVRTNAEAFEGTIESLTMEGLLAGKDDLTVWLMTNATAIADYGKANNMSNKEAIEFATSIYAQSKAMKDAVESTDALEEIVTSYGSKLSMLNSTEYEQAVNSIYTQGIASKWTAEQYKEAMDALNAYYDVVRENKFSSMEDSIGKASSKFINTAYWGQRDDIDKAVKAEEITEVQGEQLEKLLNTVTVTQELYNVLDSIGDIAFDGLVSSMEAIGDAMFKSSDAGEAFKNSLQDIGIAIVNALPNLLLQAGLQLIPTPMWGIGLGLIAASGLVAIGKGYMNAKLDSDIEGTTSSGSSITYSAKGNAWSGGNLINVPTMFNANNGLNVGGELGTEAILPLTRTTTGQLGVNASTGATNVTVPIQVNIVNETGAETEAEVNQTTNSDGSQSVDVIIKKVVKSSMANGEYDRVLSSRYGVKSRGVS
jgi:tape measure domain-containing protein